MNLYRSRHSRIVLAALVALLASPLTMGASCGSARHTATVGEHGLAQSVLKVQTLVGELAQSDPLVVTPERFKAFNVALVPVLEVTLQVNRTIRAWPPDKPAPAELHGLVIQLQALAKTVVDTFPAGASRDKIGLAVQIAINAAELIVNSLPKGDL